MKGVERILKYLTYLTFRWSAAGKLDKLWYAEEYEQLIDFCNCMLARNPSDYSALYYRGLGHEALKQFDAAIDDFRASEAVLVKHKWKGLVKEYLTRIPVQISRVYHKKQNEEQAMYYADRAVQADNHKIDGLKWRAIMREDRGDLIGASEDLNEALKRRPGDKGLIKMRDRLTYSIVEDKKRHSHEQRPKC